MRCHFDVVAHFFWFLKIHKMKIEVNQIYIKTLSGVTTLYHIQKVDGDNVVANFLIIPKGGVPDFTVLKSQNPKQLSGAKLLGKLTAYSILSISPNKIMSGLKVNNMQQKASYSTICGDNICGSNHITLKQLYVNIAVKKFMFMSTVGKS
jgi:hypothetical protein